MIKSVSTVFLGVLLFAADFAAGSSEKGFVSLFNGKDLTGWKAEAGWWRVEDGAITGQSTPGHLLKRQSYIIWKGGKPANFELRLRYRLQGGNSGIQFRSRELPHWDTSGYQADMDASDYYTGSLYEEARGTLTFRGKKVVIDPDGKRHVSALGDPAVLRRAIKDNQWNRYRIVARGPDIKLYINGVLMSHTIDRQKGVAERSGIIALQLHPGPAMKVQFKDVRLKVFPAKKPADPPAAAKAGSAPNAAAATPVSRIKIAKGFKIELLYSPPKSLGSWVSMCVDPKGRLIVCDQYNGGLCRITPPPLGGSPSETKVEKINVPLSGAQGLVWAFHSLYALVTKDGKYNSGLYQALDTNGDDQLDTVKLLKPLGGGGDHGWHSLVLGPRGRYIYAVAGDATHHPKLAGSRVPLHWGEDLLLPRLPDARGFMTAVWAPGGCVYRIDRTGQKWVLISSGYRNPYCIAFNRYGDLFTWDSDMEWDMNTPWYRPTRICLATSGSEYGWRNGSGKWPPYYPDSLPPILDIGPGSPTALTFAYNAKFPAEYRDALFMADWSYGRIYDVHFTPKGAAYSAKADLFLSGTPLPTTAMVVNPKDGALYFITGGWRIQTGLYRVTYVGDQSTAPTPPQKAGSHARALRRRLASFQGHQDPRAVDFVWPYLSSPDRFIRFTARVALEWQDPASWRQRALNETDPQGALTAMLALIRVSAPDPAHRKPGQPKPDPALEGRVLTALGRLDWRRLSLSQKLDLIRDYELAFIRLGKPDAATQDALLDKFNPLFPASSRELNAQLCRVLVYLQSPEVAQKAMALVAKAPTQEEQIEYIKSLRFLKAGWTPELRADYFRWFNKAASYRGGASFAGFLREIKKDALAELTPREKETLKPILEAKPHVQSPLAAMRAMLAGRSFVKHWTVSDLAPLVQNGLHGRNFKRGRKLFGAVGCFACHRFRNEGGAVGPDLTAAGGRFSPRDLLESIIEPSKTVSDLYAQVILTETNGETLTGRIVYLGGDNVQVNTDMFDPTAIVTVDRKKVKSIRLSKVSPMPEGLLDVLHPKEILDLMAYVLSGGDPHNPMFKH